MKPSSSVTAEFRKAFRFFLDHAGYVVGQRALGALELARAERALKRSSLRVRWESDPDAWYHVRDCEGLDPKADHEVEIASIVLPCSEHSSGCKHDNTLDSLGGIIDADSKYRRLIEAEPALNAFQKGMGANWTLQYSDRPEDGTDPDPCYGLSAFALFASDAEAIEAQRLHDTLGGSRVERECEGLYVVGLMADPEAIKAEILASDPFAIVDLVP